MVAARKICRNKIKKQMTKPLTSADFDNDWAKERQFIEMGAEKKLRAAPHSSLYFPEDTKEDHLREVVEGDTKIYNEQNNLDE